MTTAPRLVLASKSAARRAILENAAVPFEVDVADIDEDALKVPGVDPRQLAIDLAVEKAKAVSLRQPSAVVLGADQTLAFKDGLISKAKSLELAAARLSDMRGLTHYLHSGAALVKDGEVLWSGADSAHMKVRNFSDDFLADYIRTEGEGLLACVGSYRLEGMGSQLFEAIEGDYFTVLGLPLWPVLEGLRQAGVLKP